MKLLLVLYIKSTQIRCYKIMIKINEIRVKYIEQSNPELDEIGLQGIYSLKVMIRTLKLYIMVKL